MAAQKRLLVTPYSADETKIAQIAARLETEVPEIAKCPPEEIEEFAAALWALDHAEPAILVARLKSAKIKYPSHLRFDGYRLSRHLLFRWREPSVRRFLLYHLFTVDLKRVRAEFGGERGSAIFCTVCSANGPLYLTWLLKRAGMGDQLPALLDSLPPDLAAWHRKQPVMVRALMQRYLAAEEEPRQPPAKATRVEKPSRLLRKGHVQVRSLRRSLRTVNAEQRALLRRTSDFERQSQVELERLRAELVAIHEQVAAAEQEHRHKLDHQWHAGNLAMEAMRAQIATVHHDLAGALERRAAWAPCPSLEGAFIAVVADDTLAGGVRALIESAGGLLVFVSAAAEIHLIAGSVSFADAIVLMGPHVSRKSEELLRQALPAGKLVLRCSGAGLLQFDRFLRQDVQHRLSLHAARTRGGSF